MGDLNFQAEILAQKIKHIIITRSGQTSDEATVEQFYEALCIALREEVMINWTSTFQTLKEKKPRTLYFLSMEYLPGRFLGNNITNIGAKELVLATLAKMNRNYEEIIACDVDPGLGNGGLGRLSSCFLDSLATLQYPARAYGLRYQYGIFEQEIWAGKQVERPDCWLLNSYPWEFRSDVDSVSIHVSGKPISAKNKHGDDVYLIEDPEEVRALPYFIPIIGYSDKQDYSVLSMCLWSTKESPRNFRLQRYNAGFLDQAAENTSLTDVLYPNDNNELGKRMRLKQEFLLVSASLKDIIRRQIQMFGDLSQFKDKVRIQINDTHPALVIAELIRTLTKNYDFSWKEAVETCLNCCSYTNHTILSEGLEEWNENRVRELIPRQYQVIQKLNLEFCNQVRNRFPGDEERVRRLSIIEGGQIRMSHLAIYGCHKINGVAELHTEILKKEIFKDFYEMYPEKFISITNGVTQRRWLLHANPLLADFITRRIGPKWIYDFTEIKKLAPFAKDPKSQEEFLKIKKKNKEALLHYLTRENPVRDEKGKIISHSKVLPETALFDVQIKRIHEYKRQHLSALYLIMLYQQILQNPNSVKIQRLSVFGGKAAPGYERAKQIILLINALSRKFHSDPATSEKLNIAFVENYGVSIAEVIIPAADLSEQISTAGWEASGTGNMKLAMNGALTIGTEDGANIEMRQAIGDASWPFRFGGTAQENRAPYNPQEILSQDETIRLALETLKDNTFAATPEESSAFTQIYDTLVQNDTYRVLKDLRSYFEMQKKVEALFLQPSLWAQTVISNIAGMGRFSTDESIRRYVQDIWGLTRSPPDPSILTKVREEYSEHDRCKIMR